MFNYLPLKKKENYIALLQPANPNYSTRRIESACASDPSWFHMKGKAVSIIRKSVPKRSF